MELFQKFIDNGRDRLPLEPFNAYIHVLQVLGMTTGICIMLLIALFEHDLKAALGGGAHVH